jgi:hypothetical protein
MKLIPKIFLALGVVAISGCKPTANPPAAMAQRSQKELAGAFEASSDILFEAKTPDDLLKLNAVQGVKLTRVAEGVRIGLTGGDPVLLLPEVQIHGTAIVKIVITAPAEMTFQLYYLVPGQSPDNYPNFSQPLQAGRNTVYGKLTVPELAGQIRLGSGAMVDNCILESIEIRGSANRGTP